MMPWTRSSSSKDLRKYLEKATLPIMIQSEHAPDLPADGHKSHMNALVVRPETYRQLECIRHVKDVWMGKEVAKFMNTDAVSKATANIQDAVDDDEDRFSVPANGYKISQVFLTRAADINRVGAWLDNFPLATVQSAMHTIYPDTKQWRIEANTTKSEDDDIFRHFVWTAPCPEDCKLACEHKQTSVVIAYQVPWVLTDADLKNFVESDMMPSFAKNTATAMTSKQRLWAKLWDICYARRAQYFVLTTYDDWILGNFSECWTSSFVSYPRKWHVKTPTILESLVYWFASSMNKTGGWIPFSIPETVPQIAATGVAEGNDDDLPDSPIGGGRRHMPTLVQNEIVTGPTSLPLPFVSRPPSRASSASSVCAGEQVPAATGAIRSGKKNTRASPLNRKAIPMPPRSVTAKPAPPVTSGGLLLYPNLTRRGRQSSIEPPAMAAARRLTLRPRTVRDVPGTTQAMPIIIEDNEEDKRQPLSPDRSSDDTRVPQASLRTDLVGSIDQKANVLAWLQRVSPTQFEDVVPPFNNLRASPAPSQGSSTSTVVDIVKNPDPATHMYRGGWTVPTPAYYRPCP